jgi:hypothetical protein
VTYQRVRTARYNSNIAREYEPDCNCDSCKAKRAYRKANPHAHPIKEKADGGTMDRIQMKYEGWHNKCKACNLAKPCECE